MEWYIYLFNYGTCGPPELAWFYVKVLKMESLIQVPGLYAALEHTWLTFSQQQWFLILHWRHAIPRSNLKIRLKTHLSEDNLSVQC